MNCEKCHELLSDFLDGTLTGEARVLVGRHLEECPSCAAVRADLGAIVTTARAAHDYSVAPPSSRALWLRISNTIEAERVEQRRATMRAATAAAAAQPQSFLARALNMRWTLTLPQLTAAVAALVVAVSALTALSVQSLRRNAESAAAAARPAAHGQRVMSDEELEVLMQRVEQRKGRWNARMREAFERNLSVIDAAVNDSRQQLDQSPHDAVSEDALDAAMRNKKDLLRQFAEL
jgi:anti-sigma factor RsiW